MACLLAALACTAAGCEISDSDKDDRAQAVRAARTDDERRAVDVLYELLAAADAVRDDPALGAAQRVALDRAVSAAHASVARVAALSTRGRARAAMVGQIAKASGGIMADDVTGVGVSDDWLLVLCGAALVAAVITTEAGAPKDELDRAWLHVADQLRALEAAVRTATSPTAAPRQCPERAEAPSDHTQSAGRSTVDVAPAPEPASSEPDRRRRDTCETAFPDAPECGILPRGYSYPSVHAALRAIKAATGNLALKLHSERPTRTGPCPRVGSHHNVRDGSRRAGSIVCCPCCADNPGGPVKERRCRIVW